MLRPLFVLLFSVALALPAISQSNLHFSFYDSSATSSNPIFEPSMEQSLELSTAYYQAYHQLMANWTESTDSSWPLITDLLLSFTINSHPMVWVHEEFHRSVMSQYGIQSQNESYFLWSKMHNNAIYVSGVTDEALSNLKATQPADMVRLSTAGIEANYLLSEQLLQNAWLDNANYWPYLSRFNNVFNNLFYQFSCAYFDEELPTDESELERDFMGMDCRGYAHDLFQPDAAYAERGVHPSGSGVNRYLTVADLTEAEQAWLKSTAWWSLINLIDNSWFERPEQVWRGSMQMAPFGRSFGVHWLGAAQEQSLGLDLRLHQNEALFLPELQAHLLRRQLGQWSLSLKAGFGLQPASLLWADTTTQWVGNTELQIAHPISQRFELHAEIYAKSAGWQPGQVSLDQSFSTQLGFNWLL